VGHFSYKAVGRAGEHITGVVEAADRRSAVTSLADQGHFVTDLVEQAEAAVAEGGMAKGLEVPQFLRFGSHRITGKDVLAMTSQLSTALRAGLPLLNALEIIRDQQHKVAMRRMVDSLAGSVSSGQSLSEAMSGRRDVFTPLYISMIRVGETGGILDETTEQLARILGRDEKVKTSMKNASAYPIFVLVLGLASAVLVVTWILPRVLGVISTGVAILPWPTRLLMWLSGFLKVYGWVIIVLIIAGGYYFWRWMRSEGRVTWDAFKLRVPILGSVLRTIAVGRFARTLGALTKGGVTILEALGVVRDTLGNEWLAREIDEVTEKVKTGTSLASPLSSSGHFPPLLVQIVSIGEQTGRLDELLLNAAETFDGEADAAITRFVAIFPAVLILLLALIIGFIIAATLLPVVTMSLSPGAL
jgi:type II secretory pathway component PulF